MSIDDLPIRFIRPPRRPKSTFEQRATRARLYIAYLACAGSIGFLGNQYPVRTSTGSIPAGCEGRQFRSLEGPEAVPDGEGIRSPTVYGKPNISASPLKMVDFE